jgi:O-antigen ligase
MGKHEDIIWESYHRRLFLAAFDTWKLNKIFGHGIKSFSRSCLLIGDQPNVNLQEIFLPGKKNRLCSNHPHNYYLEILASTGIVGLIIVSVIALSFIAFIYKNFRPIKEINYGNFILFSAIISLILEMFPLRSSGSIFTTNNATYIVLISSIVLSYKKILEIKTE